ncbi:hypothetical protein MSAN_01037700 [Mycena sanguinolenta]|uniref:Uncharacterized protein n=1 Tax=Mycena sanguinolenta TaxID=230812 RepID=A0A8H6YMC4_9AGAR|nr:hypothetical protein MSAN_01037700 [Mycena sanguinolenta]
MRQRSLVDKIVYGVAGQNDSGPRRLPYPSRRVRIKIKDKLLQRSPIPIGSAKFAKPSTWGRTSRTGQRAQIHISSGLTNALETTNFGTSNSILLATLGVTTIAQELCHWVRAELHFPIAPPTRHTSRIHSYSQNRDDIVHGESDYLLELAMWGGMVVALFRDQTDTLEGGQVSSLGALCLGADPLWSIDEFKHDNGLPTIEYVLERLQLQHHLNQMRKQQETTFPLFNLSELEGAERRYKSYHRMRGEYGREDGENDAESDVPAYHTADTAPGLIQSQ